MKIRIFTREFVPDGSKLSGSEKGMVIIMIKKQISYKTKRALVYCVNNENGELYLIHNFDKAPRALVSNKCQCWVLPMYAADMDISYKISSKRPFQIEWKCNETEVIFIFDEKETQPVITEYSGIPSCDVMGNSVEMEFKGSDIFQKTMYRFYWETLLPSVVEFTRARDYSDSKGYVVSTLQSGSYAGTYPDVDYEFQIKGRIAMASELDLAVVKRMIELQLRMMAEDPEQAYRNPCAVQPDGVREYHVRRSSLDGSENAEMFLVTGNIEIIESAWLYYAATKDRQWLEDNIEGLENALSLVLSCMDKRGCLWTDVYYEDQIIKDGRECMTAALAVKAFETIAGLENLLGRDENKVYYEKTADKLKKNLLSDTPVGFWNTEKQRFIDWVDRSSRQHDHIHLLANELPVLFGYTNKEQTEGVKMLLTEYLEDIQRFPSFVSPRIEDYTDSEIGSGGPYDLCAAGRYWCWDFLYWHNENRKDILERQLMQVSSQAGLDEYRMGERYDMNHVYYISDKNWHGAAHYYEYPCVFIWNLLSGYLGVGFTLQADLKLQPMLNCCGRVQMNNPVYGVAYETDEAGLKITNLLEKERTFQVVWNGKEQFVTICSNESILIKTN